METIKFGSKGDAVKTLQLKLGITADGIFGKDTEKAVKDFLKNNKLTVDGIVGNNTWNALLGTDTAYITEDFITKAFIDKHISKANRDIKYLVIHYTAGNSSSEGSALKTRNVFLKRDASADFVVDDATIVLINPDLKRYYCWSVGDGSGKYGVTNHNSISIEICSNLKKNTSSSQPNHEGWYFTEDALNNTVHLTKYLMKKYNIPFDRVIRHYDASRKACPGIIGWNESALYNSDGSKTNKKNNSSEWIKFKNRLK